jgi:hypothetical protein
MGKLKTLWRFRGCWGVLFRNRRVSSRAPPSGCSKRARYAPFFSVLGLG